MLETGNHNTPVTLSVKECKQQIHDSERLLERINDVHAGPDLMETEMFTSSKRFLRQSQPPTMRDICNGSMKHINLSQVVSQGTNLTDCSELHFTMFHWIAIVLHPVLQPVLMNMLFSYIITVDTAGTQVGVSIQGTLQLYPTE